MVKLNQKFRLSLLLSSLLLLLTYTIEGWLYGLWMLRFVEHDIFNPLTQQASYGIVYSAAIAVICFFVIILASPVSLITVSLDGWLRSDTRAFLSIFVGAFTFAILVQRVDYFVRFLVMVSAVFLVKLDLQLVGLSRWFCSIVLIFLCWLGFTGGILAFYSWS